MGIVLTYVKPMFINDIIIIWNIQYRKFHLFPHNLVRERLQLTMVERKSV
ncbi:MAG: hypothetical protein ACJA0G_000258 [Kangiellaceae bacterium]|jgi:hypothetical protein